MKRLFLQLIVSLAVSCLPSKAPVVTDGFSRIRIVGRADLRDPRGPILAWPGTTITARATPDASGRIDARFFERAGAFGTSRYSVFVDGNETTRVIVLTLSLIHIYWWFERSIATD